MLVIVFLAILLGPPFVAAVWYHVSTYSPTNYIALSLLLFLLINSLICFWELALCYRYSQIRREVAKRRKEGGSSDPIIILKDVNLLSREAWSFSYWAYVWIDYCKWDSSYQDKGSFGYCIDVGNGHTTLIPSLFLFWSILCPVLSPRVTGMIGLVMFYQTFYGTILYFYQYVNNRRYVDTPWSEILGVVVFSNFIWIFFPVIGMYSSVELILSDTFGIWQ